MYITTSIIWGCREQSPLPGRISLPLSHIPCDSRTYELKVENGLPERQGVFNLFTDNNVRPISSSMRYFSAGYHRVGRSLVCIHGAAETTVVPRVIGKVPSPVSGTNVPIIEVKGAAPPNAVVA